MPFPLAHPAAVLPLRRHCPRHLNFPALVIGSLSPDLGYAFGNLHVDRLSHHFWAGSFAFCLPLGLMILWGFYSLRLRVAETLTGRLNGVKDALLAVCRRPIGPRFPIVISLLLGAWTHIFLDSLTHRNSWRVEHLAFLRSSLPWVENRRGRGLCGALCRLHLCGSRLAGALLFALARELPCVSRSEAATNRLGLGAAARQRDTPVS